MLKEPNLWKNESNYYLNVLESDWYKLLVKLENLITKETVYFYNSKNILTMHLPVTTGSISSPMGKGSDSKPVKVNICGVDTYLADSMQFFLEYGCRLTENGVYYIMPTFRGEEADERHLCQFYHSEAEIPGNLNDVMDLVEEYIKHLSRKIIEEFGEVLQHELGDITHIKKVANYKGKFPRITFDDAEKKLKEKFPDKIDRFIIYDDGFRNITSDGEKALMQIYDGLIWVTNYDKMAVPFYQKVDEKNKRSAKNADLLMGIGETVGCGERNKTDLELYKSLNEHNVNSKEYEWYIEMKKKFPLQTSGFGMGIERYLMWVLKCKDIRNMQICLRFNGRNIVP
ncbi:MAG TPA: asparaginase [Candidatus Coprosoma intestinipullorum]|uniref:Asparaginase n=1 Tax=Candidatus Coprosoma intestinipullorum TaxID=2840752 RepID=A0A9D0ZQ32_9FIRM|nr:asparaginase [Candidatus Coprosoma intestinipullorum]